MISLTLRQTKINLDFSIFAVLALFLLMDRTGFGITALAACTLHETSHLVVMTLLHIPVENITFYGAGIRICSSCTERSPLGVQAAVYLAGVAANFAAAVALFLLDEPAAAFVSLFTGGFNMLALGELDGAKILHIILIRCAPPERVDSIMKAANVISAAVCILCVIFLGGGISITLITTAAYFIALSCRRV